MPGNTNNRSDRDRQEAVLRTCPGGVPICQIRPH
jgi:hypothetical protein